MPCSLQPLAKTQKNAPGIVPHMIRDHQKTDSFGIVSKGTRIEMYNQSIAKITIEAKVEGSVWLGKGFSSGPEYCNGVTHHLRKDFTRARTPMIIP